MYDHIDYPYDEDDDIFERYQEKLQELTGLIYQMMEPNLPALSFVVANIILEEGVEEDIEAQIRGHAERLVKDFYIHLKEKGVTDELQNEE